jgi:hypothetical protein
MPYHIFMQTGTVQVSGRTNRGPPLVPKGMEVD